MREGRIVHESQVFADWEARSKPATWAASRPLAGMAPITVRRPPRAQTGRRPYACQPNRSGAQAVHAARTYRRSRFSSPERARVQPLLNFNELDAWATPIFAAAATEFIFPRKAVGPPPPQSVDLAAGQSREPGEFIRGNQRGRGRVDSHSAFPCRRACRARANSRSLSMNKASMAGTSSATGSLVP
jgi:hypothetical protein